MYAGQIIEKGPVESVFDDPRHPYTLGLFASLPRIDQKKSRLDAIEGSVPAATRFPAGCRFRERCRWAVEKCRSEPPLVTIGGQHDVACWRHAEIAIERKLVVNSQ
jgi:oligopeptide/dipeptide ABC transporter ATP-binding protein